GPRSTAEPCVTDGEEGNAALRRHQVVRRLEVIAVSTGRWVGGVKKLRRGERPPAIGGVARIANLRSRIVRGPPDKIVRCRKRCDHPGVERDPPVERPIARQRY